MRRKSFSEFNGRDLVLALSLLVVITLVTIFGNHSTYLRSKAYEQTPTGIRIEAEDMTLTGVNTDPSGTYIQF